MSEQQFHVDEHGVTMCATCRFWEGERKLFADWVTVNTDEKGVCNYWSNNGNVVEANEMCSYCGWKPLG